LLRSLVGSGVGNEGADFVGRGEFAGEVEGDATEEGFVVGRRGAGTLPSERVRAASTRRATSRSGGGSELPALSSARRGFANNARVRQQPINNRRASISATVLPSYLFPSGSSRTSVTVRTTKRTLDGLLMRKSTTATELFSSSGAVRTFR